MQGSDYGKERFQEVSTLGEDAYWIDGTLRIFQGDRFLTLEVIGLPVGEAAAAEELQELIDAKALAAEIYLSEIALGRLP